MDGRPAVTRRAQGRVPRGPGQRRGRTLAERLAIVSGEVPEIAEAANEGDRRHRSLRIRAAEHARGRAGAGPSCAKAIGE